MGLVLLKPSRRRNLCWRIKFTRRWKRRGDKKKNWSRRGLLYVSFFRREGGRKKLKATIFKEEEGKKTVNNLSHLISFSFLSGLLVYPQLNLNFSQVLIVIKSVHLRENAVIHFLLECKKHFKLKKPKSFAFVNVKVDWFSKDVVYNKRSLEGEGVFALQLSPPPFSPDK